MPCSAALLFIDVVIKSRLLCGYHVLNWLWKHMRALYIIHYTSTLRCISNEQKYNPHLYQPIHRLDTLLLLLLPFMILVLVLVLVVRQPMLSQLSYIVRSHTAFAEVFAARLVAISFRYLCITRLYMYVRMYPLITYGYTLASVATFVTNERAEINAHSFSLLDHMSAGSVLRYPCVCNISVQCSWLSSRHFCGKSIRLALQQTTAIMYICMYAAAIFHLLINVFDYSFSFNSISNR